MARLDASRRESVWFNTEIRKAPAFDVVGAKAFGLWTRLPFLVDEGHVLPLLSEIAADTEVDEAELSRLLAELMAAGFLEWLTSAGRYRLSPLSQRYYALTEPADEGEGDANEDGGVDA